MATTTEKGFFDSIRPMQCDAWMPDDLAKADPDTYHLEPKLDGFRVVAVIYPTTVGFFTREGKRQDGKIPHITEELMAKFPVGTILDGEMTAMRPTEGGKIENRFEYVQSVMLSLPERSVQLQEGGDRLTYMVFDIMSNGDEDVRRFPLNVRRNMLEQHWVGTPGWKYVGLTPVGPPTKESYDHWTGMGLEGVVVKSLNSAYDNGSRGKGWYKIKAQHTVDVVVTGFHPGEGKYTNQIGSVKFGQPIPEMKGDQSDGPKGESTIIDGVVYIERGQCSGMTDEVRLFMTEHQEDLIGTTIEVAHMGIMHGGIKMRHPQFKRARPEKPASEVIWHDR